MSALDETPERRYLRGLHDHVPQVRDAVATGTLVPGEYRMAPGLYGDVHLPVYRHDPDRDRMLAVLVAVEEALREWASPTGRRTVLGEVLDAPTGALPIGGSR